MVAKPPLFFYNGKRSPSLHYIPSPPHNEHTRFPDPKKWSVSCAPFYFACRAAFIRIVFIPLRCLPSEFSPVCCVRTGGRPPWQAPRNPTPSWSFCPPLLCRVPTGSPTVLPRTDMFSIYVPLSPRRNSLAVFYTPSGSSVCQDHSRPFLPPTEDLPFFPPLFSIFPADPPAHRS